MLEQRDFYVAEAKEILCREEAMPGIFGEFNKVVVTGKLGKLRYTHTKYGKNFYRTTITVNRLSDNVDVIPVVLPDYILGQGDIYSLKGKLVELNGEFRSNNYKGHLELSLFVRRMEILENETDKTINIIYLNGFICKPTVYRETPLGSKITDFILAVNRTKKSSYIPCITWEKAAKVASNLVVSDRIELYGRIQSRDYSKKKYLNNEYSEEKHEINEISVIRFQKIY